MGSVRIKALIRPGVSFWLNNSERLKMQLVCRWEESFFHINILQWKKKFSPDTVSLAISPRVISAMDSAGYMERSLRALLR
jgi:hypothetical protein